MGHRFVGKAGCSVADGGASVWAKPDRGESILLPGSDTSDPWTTRDRSPRSGPSGDGPSAAEAAAVPFGSDVRVAGTVPGPERRGGVRRARARRYAPSPAVSAEADGTRTATPARTRGVFSVFVIMASSLRCRAACTWSGPSLDQSSGCRTRARIFPCVTSRTRRRRREARRATADQAIPASAAGATSNPECLRTTYDVERTAAGPPSDVLRPARARRPGAPSRAPRRPRAS
jgi:hypothetical protein